MKNNENFLKKMKFMPACIIFITLIAFVMLSCIFDNPKNQIDYKNFSDDHSIDYRQMMSERIKKENVLKKRERLRKKQEFFDNFDTSD